MPGGSIPSDHHAAVNGPLAVRFRDQPWQAAVRAAEGETLERPTGFHLIVEGRLGAFADGRPVRCQSAGPDQRPLCVVRIRRDYVAFAPIGSDEIIQEWRS